MIAKIFLDAFLCLMQIKPMIPKLFNEFVSQIRGIKSVDHPWTIKETVRAHSAYTRCVDDCTSIGVINKDGITLAHLHYGKDANTTFNQVKDEFVKRIDLNATDNHGFVLGSNPRFTQSPLFFDNWSRFLEELKIPCSLFKGKAKSAGKNIAYVKEFDTLVISCDDIHNLAYPMPWMPKLKVEKPIVQLQTSFDPVVISSRHEIIF